MEPARAVRYRIAPKARLVYDRTRGKHMLIYPERGLELNGAAHAILRLCDGRHTVDAIVEALRARFEPGAEGALEGDVARFLAELAGRGVLIGEE